MRDQAQSRAEQAQQCKRLWQALMVRPETCGRHLTLGSTGHTLKAYLLKTLSPIPTQARRRQHIKASVHRQEAVEKGLSPIQSAV